MQFPDHRPEMAYHDGPDVARGGAKSGLSKQNCSLRNINTKTPLPPASGGIASRENCVDYYGTIIGIQMGNRKRIPVNHAGRLRDYEYVNFLNSKGFSARIVPETEVKSWQGDKVN